MKKLLTLIALLSFLVSCGGQEGKTNATFKMNFAVGPFSSGGLMVFGKNEDRPGTYISKRIISAGEVLELENGTWSFVTVAWDGANFLEGTVKCAGVDNVELGGGDQDIAFNLVKKRCQADDLFGLPVSQGDVGQFNPLTLISCNNQYAINENEAENTADDCVKGATQSFRIIIPEFDESGAVSIDTGLKSTCQNYGSVLDQSHNTNLRIPIFNDPAAPLTFIIKSFAQPSCAGPVEVFNMKPDYKTKTNVSFYQNKNNVFVKSNYCQGAHLTNGVMSNTVNFRSGTWYVICNPTQFKTAFISNSNNKFVLGQDIDFLGEDLALSSPMNITSGGELDGNGRTVSNFNHNYTGSNTGNGALFGSIDGNIENLRIANATGVFDYGTNAGFGTGILFGKIGANTTIKIKDIELDNIHMDIINNEGTTFIERIGLVGGNFSTSTGEVKGIKITNSSITLDGTGGSDIREVGAVFGRLEGPLRGVAVNGFNFYSEAGNTLQKTRDLGGVVGKTMTNVSFNSIEVEGLNITIDHPAQAIGGVVGSLAEAMDFTSIGAQGVINLTENTLTHPDIGGIAGNVTHATIFNAELVNSRVDINAFVGAGGAGPVGGIFGKVSASTSGNLRMVKYEGTISGKTSCGGVVGTGLGAGSIDYSSTKGTVTCNGGTSGGIIASGGTFNISSVHSSMTVNSTSSAGAGGLIGSYGAATLDNSYFEGILSGANAATDGLLVGNCTACNVTNSYASVGGASQTAIGTANTIATNSCALVDNGGTNTCMSYTSLANLNTNTTPTGGSAAPSFAHINWELAGDGKYRQFSDKFFNRYIDNIGSVTKPFGLSSISDWELFGKLQLIEPSFKIKGAHYILLSDLDFQNNPALFTPWAEFKGKFKGNDNTILNVTKAEASSTNLGLFRNMTDGAEIDHETPTGFRTLYLKNINLSNSGSGHVGGLAGDVNTTGGWIGVYGVQLWNSTLTGTGPGKAGGLIGSLTSSTNDNVEIEDIKIVSSAISSTGSAGTGGVAGSIALTGGATNMTLFNINVDSATSVTGQSSSDIVGGVVGSATNIIGAALVNSGIVDGNDTVGGIAGQVVTSGLNTVSTVGDGSVCSLNCGGIVGISTTSNIDAATNMLKFSGTPSAFYGSGGGTFTNVISGDGNAFDNTSTARTATVSCFVNPPVFCETFSLMAEHFYWVEGDFPRLRWIETLKNHQP